MRFRSLGLRVSFDQGLGRRGSLLLRIAVGSLERRGSLRCPDRLSTARCDLTNFGATGGGSQDARALFMLSQFFNNAAAWLL